MQNKALKILCSIVLSLCFSKAVAQFPVTQLMGSPSAFNKARGAVGSDSTVIFAFAFSDTTQANRGWIDGIPGAIVRTTGGFLWMRNDAATAWIYLGGSAGSGDNIYNIDGTLTGDRIVTMNGNTLSFVGLGQSATVEDSVIVRTSSGSLLSRAQSDIGGGSILCNVLLQGGVVTWAGSGLVFDISPAKYKINCEGPYSSPQSQVTLDAADPTNPRFDVIYADVNGDVGVITGTASANPEAPQIDPATQIELTFIRIDAGSVTPPLITVETIYDENLGTPSEWAATATGVTVDYDNTVSPFHLTKAGSVGAVSDVSTLTFTNNVDITLSDYNSLKFYILLKATFAQTTQFQLVWYKDGTKVSSGVTVLNNTYGYVRTTVGTYMTITIPVTDWTLTQSDVDALSIQTTGGNASGFYIDWIQLQAGIPVPGGGGLTSITVGNLSPLFTSSVINPNTNAAVTFSLNTQTANTVFAGPTTGSAAAPTFRALVAADLPSTSPYTWQQTLTAGSTLTGNNTIAGGNFNLRINNTGFSVGRDDGGTTTVSLGSVAFGSTTNTGEIVSTGNGSLAFGMSQDGGISKIESTGSGSLAFGFASDGGVIRSTSSGSFAGGQAVDVGAVDTIEATHAGSFAFGYTDDGNLRVNAENAYAFGGGFDHSLQKSFALGWGGRIFQVSQDSTTIGNLSDFADTTNYKPVVANATGTLYKATYWPGGGGSQTLQQVITTGATLTGDNTIINNGNTLTITGTAASDNVFAATNSSSGGALSGTSNSGVGVFAISTSNNGLEAQSSSGSAISAASTSGKAISATIVPASTNTVVAIMTVSRATSGTAANNIGGSIEINVEDDGGTGQLAGVLSAFWTDVISASRTSQLNLRGVNSTTTETFANFQTGGIVRVNNLADTLATKAYARSVGGGGAGTVTDFIFTDGSGFDGTVATSTSTPTLSLTTTVTAGQSMFAGTSGAITGDDSYLYNTTDNKLTIGQTTGGTGTLNISRVNTDFTNTSGAGSVLFINNTSATGQTVLYSQINGTMNFKVRGDYTGNMNWISAANVTTSGHNFYINGDYPTGSLRLAILRDGVTIGKFINASPTAATALLHIMAGTATASTAPLKLTTGVVLTTAEAGAMEYTTPQLFFTNGTAIRQEIPLIQQSRVTAEFSKDNTTLENITGLTANVANGSTYRFEAILYTTSAVAGGVKMAISGTATATEIIYEGLTTDAGLITQSRATALDGTVGAVTAVTAAYVRITGIISVSGTGTLTVQFAQNVADGTSEVLAGSTFVVTQIL